MDVRRKQFQSDQTLNVQELISIVMIGASK